MLLNQRVQLVDQIVFLVRLGEIAVDARHFGLAAVFFSGA